MRRSATRETQKLVEDQRKRSQDDEIRSNLQQKEKRQKNKDKKEEENLQRIR